MEQNTATPPKGGKAVRTILEWTEEIVLAVVLIAVVFTFVCRVVTVTGTSMVPSFHEGDRVLVVNDFNGVEQGDVVVIVNVLEEPIIKRVIATEGQTVDFDYEAGVVYVDGQPVDETQFGLENGITSEPFSSFELLEFPQTVPEGCVFVLGDNRAVSEDSRYQDVGMIDERNILGKAVFHLFPFQSLGPGYPYISKLGKEGGRRGGDSTPPKGKAPGRQPLCPLRAGLDGDHSHGGGAGGGGVHLPGAGHHSGRPLHGAHLPQR